MRVSPQQSNTLIEAVELPAAFNPKFCDCMAIAVDSSATEGLDMETATAFEVIPGRYWLMGYQDAEKTLPIFKQELPLELDGGHCISEHDALSS